MAQHPPRHMEPSDAGPLLREQSVGGGRRPALGGHTLGATRSQNEGENKGGDTAHAAHGISGGARRRLTSAEHQRRRCAPKEAAAAVPGWGVRIPNPNRPPPFSSGRARPAVAEPGRRQAHHPQVGRAEPNGPLAGRQRQAEPSRQAHPVLSPLQFHV